MGSISQRHVSNREILHACRPHEPGKTKQRQPGRSKFEKLGDRHADALGLWLHFDGHQRDRTWHIYDRTSGKCLGWWKPSSGRYRLHGADGSCSDRWTVLRMAAGLPLEVRKEQRAGGLNPARCTTVSAREAGTPTA